MEKAYLVGVPLAVMWIASTIVFYITSDPITAFVAGLGMAVGGAGLGVQLWYLIKKSWRIPDRGILFGIAIGLYGLIGSMLMYIYNVGGWREVNLLVSILAGLLVPVRASMLWGEE